MIVSTAPGRCGLVGNPSDMYGGSVISVSTRERARCEIAESDILRIESSGETAHVTSPEGLALRGDKLDVVRAALTWFKIDATTPLSITLSTEIAMQAGMAGSTALLVALVGALDRRFGWKMHPWQIAETSRKIEFRVMRVVCGLQDQHMAVFGGLNYMDFGGKESLEQRDDEPLATIEPLHPWLTCVPLVAAHTGIPHDSGSVHRSPRERWLAGEKLVIETYRRIGSLARIAKRALIAGDWPALGSLMNENHALVANLGGSGPVNDRLIEAAREAGAYGAKLAGAGGGGTILALAEDTGKVGNALLKAGADSLFAPEPMPGLTVVEE